MSIDSLFASKAYIDAASQALNPGKGIGVAEQGKTGSSFGDMLETMVQDAVDVGKASEAQIIASTTGEAELVDVITAITAAEITLETVIAVRDKVIEAYESIMRMPI